MEKMARILGGEWQSSDVYTAARYFQGATQEKLILMANEVLSLSPSGKDADAFPLEHKDLFYAACVEATIARWGVVPVVQSEPPARPLPSPSYYVLRELAAIWAVTPASLLLESEGFGQELRTEVVLTVDQASQLKVRK